MRKFFLVISLLIIFACGCGTSKEQVARKSFEQRIASDIKVVESRIQEPRGLSLGGRESKYYAKVTHNDAFDIKKTDSIVSPYEGNLDIEIDWYCNDEYVSKQHIVADYVYQDENWVMKSAARVINGKPNDDKEEQKWAMSLFPATSTAGSPK